MPIEFPIALLRSLSVIAETGTLAGAARRLHRTPSALSLQMAKLSELAGAPLFEPKGRLLALTAAGWLLAAHARTILRAHDEAVTAMHGTTLAGQARLGLVQDFADTLLTPTLTRLRDAHPKVQVQIRIAGSRALRQAIAEGDLDVAVVALSPPGPTALVEEEMVWVGNPPLCMQDPLPLALVSAPCPFSDAAMASLDALDRGCHVAVQTPSLAGIHAAIAAGLGIGCRTRRFAGTGLPILGAAEGLPALPRIGWGVVTRRTLSAAARTLDDIIQASLRSFG